VALKDKAEEAGEEEEGGGEARGCEGDRGRFSRNTSLKKRMMLVGFRNPNESQAKRMCKSRRKRAGNAEHVRGGG
jgi:hypothetical protein